MRRRLTITLAALVAAAVATACGTSPGSTAARSHTTAPATTAPVTAASGRPSAGATGAPGATATAAPGAKSTTASTRPPVAGTSPGAAATTPPASQWEATPAELPIEAVVSPGCVVAGSTATLTVHTVPKGSVGFLAVYAGNQSGAPAPWGKGYGGNASGAAGGDGEFQSAWAVSATAPSGDAYVMVVVGSKGKQRQIKTPFTVVPKVGGHCAT